MQTVAIILLSTFCAAAVAWVLVYPLLSGEKEAEKRVQRATRSGGLMVKAASRGKASRRDQIEASINELESRRKKAKSPSLAARFAYAGVSWTKRQFIAMSATLGVVVLLAVWLLGGGPIGALGLGFAAGVGLPRWVLTFLKRRREKKFLGLFPDTIDVIVRGIKSGLPLGDSLRAIAAESAEPVRSEFRHIIETQAIGISLGDACAKLFERMPVAEANFFAVVITIQQKSGGNLSEALGNLSKVLRDRKKMRGKIQAMSSEAKASAAIIASLPIAVMSILYLTNPSYISLLFTSHPGQMLLAGSAMWMSIGVFIMKKMINFDF
jgi:tight adherence protein B